MNCIARLFRRSFEVTILIDPCEDTDGLSMPLDEVFVSSATGVCDPARMFAYQLYFSGNIQLFISSLPSLIDFNFLSKC
nr:hypothetical protein [Neorhizobium tomejilense]